MLSTSPLMEQLLDSFTKIEFYDERVVSIYVTPKFFDLIKKEELFYEHVNIDLVNEERMNGGYLFGANIYVDKNLKKSVLVGEQGRKTYIDDVDIDNVHINDNNTQVKFKFILGEN